MIALLVDSYKFLSYHKAALLPQTNLKCVGTLELAKWLAHGATKLTSRVSCLTRSSSMMHILHYNMKTKAATVRLEKRKDGTLAGRAVGADCGWCIGLRNCFFRAFDAEPKHLPLCA